MKNSPAIFIFILAITMFLISGSFALEKALRTEDAKNADIRGSFTVILYGSRHSSDIETLAILDIEGDDYTFEPYAPEFDYRMERGLPAREAVERAEQFISWHHSFQRPRFSRIIDNKGSTIGYEIRPLYYPLTFGEPDVLYTDYIPDGNKVSVIIKLKPSVERQIYRGNGLKDRDD